MTFDLYLCKLIEITTPSDILLRLLETEILTNIYVNYLTLVPFILKITTLSD